MAMKKAKVVKKVNRRVNTQWLNNAMKSIGAASLDSFKDIAPNLFEAGSSAATVARNATSVVRNSRQSLNSISRSLANNQHIQVGKRAIDKSIEDLKSGNLYNSSRSFDLGGADDFDMDGWDFEDDSDDGSSSVSFTYVNEDKGNESDDGSLIISESIQKAADSSLKAQKATIDTMISLASVSISQNQRTLDEVGNHLTNITNTLSAILEFHQENTKQFYESSIAAFEKIGGAVADDDYSYEDDDPLAIFNKNGGINFEGYKNRVKKNIKDAIEKSPGGAIIPFLEDPDSLEMLLADPIGGLTKGLIGSMIPKIVQGTVEQVEETFTNFIPNMVAKMTSWADDMDSSKFQRFIGKIFGLDLSNMKNLNIDGEINKEAATFDRITRNSIAEVLPKYARESTEYLKQIAMHVTHKSADKLLGGAEIFDYETTSYRTADDMRKDLAESMKDAITSTFTDSEFGKVLQSAGSKLNDKDKELYNKSLDQLFVQLSRQKNLDVSSFNFDDENSAIHDVMKGINGKTRDERKVKRMIESSIRRMYSDQFGIDTASLAQMKSKIANTSKLKDYSKNYDMYNILALGLNNTTDMDDFLDRQMGYHASVKGREAAKRQEEEQLKANTRQIAAPRRSGSPVSDEIDLTERSLRRGTAKDLSDEGIDEYLAEKQRAKEEKRNRLGERVDAITGDFGNGFARMGSHLSGSMWALMKGDSKGAVGEFSKIFSDTMKSMWEGTKEHFFDPLAKNIFGEKDENGYLKNGLFGSTRNKVKDTYKELIHKINGKPWVDSEGKEHGAEDDPDASVVGKVTNIFKEVKESVQYRLFGKGEDGESKTDKAVGIVGGFAKSIGEGLKGWKELLFGKNEDGTEKDAEQLKQQVMDAVPDALVGAGGGALVGIMAGGSGGSLLGTLIGGPIAGAAIGMGTSLLMRNEKFQNYLFGPEITNEDGEVERVGGLISAKTQKFFKDNKKTIVGGAALGALKGVFTGGGIMGTLLGGPIGGAAMGVGLSLLKESDMFKEFLYGNPEKGRQGVVNAFKGIFKGKGSSGDDKKDRDSTLKSLGMGAVGAAGFGLTAAMVGKMGLLGAMVTPGGPIGAAVLGLTVGIASQSNRFKEFLFGKEVEDKDGNKKKKGGLFGKMANYLHVEIFAPAKSKMLNILDDVKTTVKYDILDNIRLPFIAAADAVKERIGNLANKARTKVADFAQNILEKAVKPIGKIIDGITRPARAILGKAADVVYNTSKAIITAPFKLARHIASYTRTRIHKFGKAFRHFVFKKVSGLFGLAGKALIFPFKLAGKALGKTAEKVGNASNFFKDHADLSKKGSLKEKLYRFGANITSDDWRTDHRNSRADAIEKRRENRIEARKREQRDYNRAKMARMLGYDARYFTKENAEEAMRVAKEKGKKLKFRGNLEDLYEDDPAQKARELLKKSTADIAREGDKSEDVNVRQLSEQYHTNEILRNIEKLCQGLKEDGATEEEVNATRREMIQEEIDSGFDALGGGEYVGTRKAKKNQKKFEKARRKDGSSFEDAVNSFIDEMENGDSTREETKESFLEQAKGSIKNFLRRHGRARAKGGPAEEGKALLVGDGGSDPSAEELFIPKTDGSIVSQKDGAINVRIIDMDKDAYDDFVEAQIEASKKTEEENKGPGVKKGITDEKQKKEEVRTFVQEAITQSKIIEAKEKQKEAIQARKAKLKEENDKIESGGTYAAKKAAAEAAAKEKEERSFRQKLLEMIGGLKNNEEEHQSLWSKLFNPKNGLLFLKLLAAGALIKGIYDKAKDIIDAVKDGVAHLKNNFDWINKIGGRTNGDSIADRVKDNVEDAKEVIDDLKNGDFIEAAKDFVLDEGEWDAESGARARFLGRGAMKVKKPVAWLGKKIGKGIKKTGSGIVKGGKAIRKGIGNAKDLFMGISHDESMWATFMENQGDDIAAKAMRNGKVKQPGILKRGASKLTSSIKKSKPIETIVEATQKGPMEKVIKTFTKFIDDLIEAVVKRFPKIKPTKLAGSLKGLKGEVIKIIGKRFPKIAAKLSATTAGHAAGAALSFGLSEAGFAIAGGINGASGAKRLFQTDDIDGFMVGISIAFGAALATGVGTVIDIISGLVTDTIGIDLIHELACIIYQAVAGEDNYDDLLESQQSFKDEYEDYVDSQIQAAYEKQKKSGEIGEDVTIEQFREGVDDGTYEAEYKSFQDYNADEHQTIGYKIGKGLTKAGGAIKSGVGKIKSGIGKAKDGIKNGINNAKEMGSNVVDGVKTTFKNVKDGIGGFISKGVDVVTALRTGSDKIKANFNNPDLDIKGYLKADVNTLDKDNPLYDFVDTMLSISKYTSLPGLMVGGVLKRVSGEYNKLIKAKIKVIGGTLGEITSNKTRLDQIADSGNMEALSQFTPNVNEENPLSGFSSKIIDIMKYLHAPTTLLHHGGNIIKAGIQAGLNVTKMSITETLSNIAAMKQIQESGNMERLREFEPQITEGSPLSGIASGIVGTYKLYSYPVTMINHAGDVVKASIAAAINTVKKPIEEIDKNMDRMGEISKRGDVDALKSYEPDITEGTPLSGIAHGVVSVLKVPFYLNAGWNHIGNKVGEFFGNLREKKEEAKEDVQEFIARLGTYTSNDKSMDGYDSEMIGDGTGIFSKFMSPALRSVFKEIIKLKRGLNKVGDAVGSLFNGEDGEPGFVESALNKIKDFANGGKESPTEVAEGGSGRGRRKLGGRGEEPSTENGFAYYSQEDPRWKNRSYVSGLANDGATMGDSGCGPTALAMVASEMSGNKPVSPTDMANLASASGYRDETGTNAEFINYASNNLGMPSQQADAPSAGYLQQQVASGNPVILNGASTSDSGQPFTKSGHYLVAVGTDDKGDIIVNDPRGKNYSKTYSPDTLAKQTARSWSFPGGNGRRRRRFGGRGLVEGTSIQGGDSMKDGRITTGEQKLGAATIAPGPDWLSIVQTVKKLIAEQQPGYNQSGSVDITINGKTLNVRTDCSGFVSACLRFYGAIPETTVYNSSMLTRDNLPIQGFTYMPWPGWEGLQPGDIMAVSGHTEISNGGHNVYNCGSTNSVNNPNPTTSSHTTYTNIWRPNNAGKGGVMAGGSAGGAAGSSGGSYGGGASISGTDGTGKSGGIMDFLGTLGKVGSAFASKAMNGILTGNWDFDFSDVIGSGSSGGSSSGGAFSSGGSAAGGSSSGYAGGSVTAANVNPDEAAKALWDTALSKGITPAGAAGMLGNFQKESGVRPNNLQNSYERSLGMSDESYTAAVDNGSYNNFVNDKAGYGFAQWTFSSRKQGLLDLARSKGTSIADPSMQTEYLYQELENGYPDVLNVLKTTNNVVEASNAMLHGFEKPGDQSAREENERASYAQGFYDKLINSGSNPNPGQLGGTVALANSAAGFKPKGGAGRGVLGGRGRGPKIQTINYPKPLYIGKKLGGFGEPDLNAIAASAQKSENFSGVSVQKDPDYRVYDQGKTTTIYSNNASFDTTQLEALFTKAVEILQAIEGNTAKIEGLSVGVNNGGNVVVNDNSSSSNVTNTTPSQTTSRNSELASQIAKGR